MSDGGARAEARARGALALLAMGLVLSDAGEGAGGLSYDALKRGFREALLRDPIDALAVLVLGGSYLFHLAEQDVNPRCTTFLDALTFITTSLSVGYDDVFARSEAGKAIASFVMTFGPALSGAALDPPRERADDEGQDDAASRAALESIALQRAILDRLDALLEAVRKPA